MPSRSKTYRPQDPRVVVGGSRVRKLSVGEAMRLSMAASPRKREKPQHAGWK